MGKILNFEDSLFQINEEFYEVYNTPLHEYSRLYQKGLYGHADKTDELMDLCYLYKEVSERQKDEEQEATYALTEYLFITINPYPDVSLTHLQDSLLRFQRLKPIQGYVKVIE